MNRSHLWSNWKFSPRGDYESLCDMCGAACPRSKLRRKADRLLYCPDCQDGRDVVTLTRLNSQYRPRRPIPQDGGGFDSRVYTDVDEYRVFGVEFSKEFS